MIDQDPREVAKVVAELPLSRYLVALADGVQLTAYLSRGLVHRRRAPRFCVGDRVLVERSPFESSVCRIVASGGDA